MAETVPLFPDEPFLVTLNGGPIDGGDGFDTVKFGGLQAVSVSTFNTAVASGGVYRLTDPTTGASGTLEFRNIESLVGSTYADRLTTNAQITLLTGEGGDDVLTAQIDMPFSTTMRGGEGDDSLVGSDLFDDLNGNQGADTVRGGGGGDWVLGGKDNDVLFGDAGNDFVQGNLGDDTADGGDGADTVRGGQGDDRLFGGPGADHLFGDLGRDTLSGGAGADVFHIEISHGGDVIDDFSYAEGDRVRVDGDVDFRAEQVGADVRITLVYGTVGIPATAEFLVRNTQLSSLPDGWISH